MNACLLAAIAVTALSIPAAAHEITFADPKKFADIGAPDEVATNVKALQAHIERLAQEKLPADSSLHLEVMNVDLAGDRRLRGGGQWVRVMNGRADWPIITVRYSYRQPGEPELSGNEMISDPLYLDRGRPISDDPLRYERRMLAEWFQDRLVERKPGPPPPKAKEKKKS